MNYTKKLLAIAGISLLAGCSGSIHEDQEISCQFSNEQTNKANIRDIEIRDQLNAILGNDSNSITQINNNVKDGRVLLSGIAEKPEDRLNAVSKTWEVKGVKEVINELQVEDTSGLSDFAADVIITAQVRAKLSLEKNKNKKDYVSVTVDTVNGNVYLFGRAKSQKEINHISYIASRVKGVKKVINKVTVLKG